MVSVPLWTFSFPVTHVLGERPLREKN